MVSEILRHQSLFSMPDAAGKTMLAKAVAHHTTAALSALSAPSSCRSIWGRYVAPHTLVRAADYHLRLLQHRTLVGMH